MSQKNGCGVLGGAAALFDFLEEFVAEGAYSYKYCVGDYADKATAQANVATIRKSFPQAFVIAVKDGKVVVNK